MHQPDNNTLTRLLKRAERLASKRTWGLPDLFEFAWETAYKALLWAMKKYEQDNGTSFGDFAWKVLSRSLAPRPGLLQVSGERFAVRAAGPHTLRLIGLGELEGVPPALEGSLAPPNRGDEPWSARKVATTGCPGGSVARALHVSARLAATSAPARSVPSVVPGFAAAHGAVPPSPPAPQAKQRQNEGLIVASSAAAGFAAQVGPGATRISDGHSPRDDCQSDHRYRDASLGSE